VRSAKGAQPCRQTDAGTVDIGGLGVPVLRGYVKAVVHTGWNVKNSKSSATVRIPRRTWLQFGGAAGLLTCFDGKGLAAAPDAKLPPSIAALESMRSLVKPITLAERQARIERARELMVEHKIDAIMLTGGTSLNYFTGVRWGNSERLFSVVIPAKGRAFSVCPSFEKGRAEEQLNKSPLESAEVLTWNEDESPFQLLAKGLKDRGIAGGSVGVEERTQFAFSNEVGKAAPGAAFVDATVVTAGCRMIKSAHEIELMSIANQATLKVYKAVYQALEPGMTQRDAGNLVDAAYARVGFRGEASIEVGEYSANPHGSLTPQTIKEGSMVLIDDGCTVEGYVSDITRSFVLGTPTDKMKRVFDLVYQAQKAALEAVHVGAECQSIDAAARKVIVDGGFGPDYKYFGHRVGHGIGMDGHEWPYLVRGNKTLLQAGMTFSDEPGIYIPGEFGLRLEDDMQVTPNGGVMFTPQSKSLELPFD
jgi:Xaa-Pro dipeptidase